MSSLLSVNRKSAGLESGTEDDAGYPDLYPPEHCNVPHASLRKAELATKGHRATTLPSMKEPARTGSIRTAVQQPGICQEQLRSVTVTVAVS